MAFKIGSCTVISNDRDIRVGVITAQYMETEVGSATPLGAAVEGGYLICKSGTTGWIIATKQAEVIRCQNCNCSDSVARACEVSGCTGWFMPSCSIMKNPGYQCRNYWDYSNTAYWANGQEPGGCCTTNVLVNMCDGNATQATGGCSCPSRAFRCVTLQTF